MNIKNILKELVTYYECTRQVGHTTAVIEGVRYKPKTIVVTNYKEMSNHYRKVCSDEINTIILQNIGSSLRGRNEPIVFDNAALYVIFSEALKIIESIETKNNSNQEKDIFDSMDVLSGDIEEVVIKGIRYKKITETKTTWKRR
ncbi:MAG: hypothetical protein EB127_11365 [Alphaproteobacteria bacterium]|nr:hypothetical protein [Alphaproteobacteria bacterium]